MPTWFEDIAGPGYAGAVMWTLVALVALGVVMLIVRIARRVSSGTYASAGNYRARLAVIDAAEVDAQRRLVLVRRDEVEHLVMIGGPTDIVIEQNITGPGRSAAQTQDAPRRRPEHTPGPSGVEPAPGEPRAAPVRRPMATPAPDRREDAPVPRAEHTVHPESGPPVQTEAPRVEPAITQRVAATAPNVDEGMVSEFERDFRERDEPAVASPRRELSIEDEMNRLLNEPPQERR